MDISNIDTTISPPDAIKPTTTSNRDKTGELIRQIPPEELLIIREKMAELTGLLFDQRI